MDYKHRFAFSTHDTATVRAMKRLGIEYTDRYDIGVVEIMESDPRWLGMKRYLDMNDMSTMITTVFTKAEIAKAEWFTIRSKWRWDYPQPDSDDFGYIKGITYSGRCPECGANAIQVGKFRVRKSPKWNTKAFLMLNWVEDVLFLSEKAKTILEASDLKGFGFSEVLNTRGKAVVPDIYQLCVDNCLPEGMLINEKYIRLKYQCPVCGTKKYVLTGRGVAYKKGALDGVKSDIIAGGDILGDGHLACRKLIISRKFYETIKANKLGNQLELHPVIFE